MYHDTNQPTYMTQAKKIIHKQAVQRHLTIIPDCNVLNISLPEIDKTETDLSGPTSRLLTNKSPYPRLISFSKLPPVWSGGVQRNSHFHLPPQPNRFEPGVSLVEP